MLETPVRPSTLEHEAVDFGAMPKGIQTYFSRDLEGTEFVYEPDQPEVIQFQGVTSYVLPVHVDTGTEHSEEQLRVRDVDGEGRVTGNGIVSLSTSDDVYEAWKTPYVRFTHTRNDVRGQGLGTRRLRLMNELSLQHFGMPLSSDPTGNTSPEAARVWQRLVGQGEAEVVERGGLTTYRFKD